MFTAAAKRSALLAPGCAQVSATTPWVRANSGESQRLRLSMTCSTDAGAPGLRGAFRSMVT